MAEYKKYLVDLIKFAIHNKFRINLERSKYLLRTLPQKLRILDQKERNRKVVRSGYIIKDLYVTDHLPFVDKQLTIAKSF